jgi:mandelamide amidase
LTDDLNALVDLDVRFEARLAAARGPLAGWTLAVKANIEVEGLPAAAGTAALADWVAPADAPLVARLRAAGATVLGTANMHELAFGATSAASLHGPVRNPRDPQRAAGGSSGGSAAAVAAGLVDAAIGTDTGGSCRIPAALCGCVGFRPSAGRYPAAGIVSLSPTRDTAGPLTRSVADARRLDAIIADDGEDGEAAPVALAGLRLGLPRTPYFEDLDPALAAVVEGALARLAAAGAVLVDVDMTEVAEINARCAHEIVRYEAPRELALLLALRRLPIGLREAIAQIGGAQERAALEAQLGPDAVSADTYRRALVVERPRLQDAYARAFADAGLDALALPTTPVPAPRLDEDVELELNGRRVPTFLTLIRNTDAPSTAGLPCLSIPAGDTAAGLPVGLELVGPADADRRLLRLGEAAEAALSCG